ncbi:unnamed protein product [Ectocarpus sp. CCAP 1310/34]|nr:unnamed protein product [Ectocarpus sp. CCAP 1310/34]
MSLLPLESSTLRRFGNEQRAAGANIPPQAAAGVKRTRVNADLEVAASDPVQAAITSGPRGGEAAPRPAKAPRKPTRVEKRRADVLEMVRKDPVSEEEMRTMLGVQGLEGVAAVHAENTRTMAASLAALKGKSQSNIGRVAYTTVLAAVAGAGEHTCSPTDPCNPAERCPPAEPQGGVSFAQRAESLGVREKTFRAAHVRMHHTDHTIPPPQALEEGRYCWTTRKTRSDATDERVLELAIRFWHCDDVSRASGDSPVHGGGEPGPKA